MQAILNLVNTAMGTSVLTNPMDVAVAGKLTRYLKTRRTGIIYVTVIHDDGTVWDNHDIIRCSIPRPYNPEVRDGVGMLMGI